jgi:tRNA A-37 threonylcarbamoyl transferase component Bud32
MADFLGKYELRAVLGKGAMGTVYAGFDPLIARQVAIKTVRLPEPDDLEAQDELARFKREAQAAGRLSHPNIVGVFDYGETPEIAYIVMEFVDGTTLKHLTDKKDRFELPEIVRLMTELMAGLQYSHDRGVVHRDIKPANIMLTKKGEVKIADFGIARIESSSMTQAGTMLGTPSYMSPEQFMGQTVDARTDLYSSGVLLYQLLTGEKPFEGGLTAIMHKVLNTEPPAPSALSVTVPGAFDAVVKKAMAKRPEDRFASATEFAQAVRAAYEAKPLPAMADGGFGFRDLGDGDATMVSPARPSQPPAPPPPGPMPLPKPPAAKKGAPLALIGGIVAALVILGGGGAFFILGGKSSTAVVNNPTTPSVTPVTPPAVQPKTPAVTPPVITPPAPPALTGDQVMAAVNSTLASLPCTLLTVSGTLNAGTGTLTIHGIAGAGAPQAALTAAEKSLPAQVSIADQVQTIDGPYCDALNAIRPYSQLFGNSGVTLSLTGGTRLLHNNDAIGADETLPAGTTVVETDYFQGDGTVYHPPAPKLSPGQTAVSNQIGTVSAPYGTDLMLAVASSVPLFTTARTQLESDTDYLPALRLALQNAVSSGAQVSVAAIPVVTAH